MKVSLARFDGETVLFVKPDNAVELVKISTLLGISIKEHEPPKRQGDFGKKPGYRHSVKATKTCFYCNKEYPVKIVKLKVWRNYCSDKKCRRAYANDRHLLKTGRIDVLQTDQLRRNLKEIGFRVGKLRK